VRIPNFVVIGAPKCGTTSLFYYLKQHPDIYLPVRKELHYFSFPLLEAHSKGPRDKETLSALCASWEEYKHHYLDVRNESAVGEVSPSYLFYAEVGERIKSRLGNVRIIAILRDPIEKAFSQYMHMVRDRRETLTFHDALMAESERKARGWGDIWLYAESSLYADKLKRYFSIFGRKNVRVILFEELANQPVKVMADLYEFLGVSADFACDTSKAYNRSGNPRLDTLSKFMASPSLVKSLMKRTIPERIRIPMRLTLMNWNTGEKDDMDDRSREYLKRYFQDDIVRLGRMLGREMNWLS